MMNDITISTILEDTTSRIKSTIASTMTAKKRVASGRTIREISSDVTKSADGWRGIVYVPKWFPFIERGSAPAPRGKWFYHVIHRWAKDKHIITGDTPAERRISGAIAHSIIENGTHAYQIGGEDVYSTDVQLILDDLNELLKEQLINSAKNF